MGDTLEALFGIIVTVLSGALIFIIQKAVDQMWIAHLNNYKKLKGEIAYHLVFLANVYSNPASQMNDEYEKASKVFRELSASLAAFAEVRPALCLFVPSPSILKEASRELIGMSNGMYERDGRNTQVESNEKRRIAICRLLNIHY